VSTTTTGMRRRPATKQASTQLEINFSRADAEGALEALVLPSLVVREGKSLAPVSGGTLKGVLIRVAQYQWGSGVTWASAGTIARYLNRNPRTVGRALKGLEDLQLLHVVSKRTGLTTRYAIDWGQVALMSEERRQQPDKPARRNLGHSDANLGHSDANLGHSDANLGHSDGRTLNNLKEPSLTTHPERSSETAAPIAPPDPWEVVASELLELEMSPEGTASAIRKARQTMTIDKTMAIIAKYRRLLPDKPEMTIGYLHRWLTGRSAVPPDPTAARASPRPHMTTTSLTTQRILLESRIVKAGRAAGAPEAVIQRRIQEARADFDRIHQPTTGSPIRNG